MPFPSDDELECGTLSTLVLRLCERVTGAVLGWPSFAYDKPWAGGGCPSERRNARLASEFLRICFTVAGGAVVVPSLSDPVGVGGSAVLGAGRGGGIDKRWLPRAFENAPTCWGFELVVAMLYTLLDVLVRFEAICRLDMILGRVFCDCEEVRLGERSSCGDNALLCHGGGCGTVDTGVGESSGGGVARRRLEDWRDQRRALPFSVVVELLDIEFARGFPRSDHALSNGGRVVSGTGTPKLPAVLVLPWLYTS